MAAVAPADILSATNPTLDTFTSILVDREHGPVLADPFALAFQIFDVRDDNAPASQVFPSTPGTRHAVDLVADKIGLGHFAAAWTVPSNASLGRYEIRWFLTQVEGDAERAWRREFEVLAQVPHGSARGYALLADVRDEGVSSEVRNRRIVEAIEIATRLIEGWTGRVFGPAYKTIKVDGLRSPLVLLDEPICAVEAVTFTGDDAPVDANAYRVYARHLSQGLLSPDDRDSPKIQFVRSAARGILADAIPVYPFSAGLDELRAPRARRAQEITIAGVFGYTDPEPGGSPVGVLPPPIRRACVLLALRNLPKAVSQADQAYDALYGHRVVRDQTREQSRQWAPRLASDQIAPYSGDPAIDAILLTYQKPLSGGGV